MQTDSSASEQREATPAPQGDVTPFSRTMSNTQPNTLNTPISPDSPYFQGTREEEEPETSQYTRGGTPVPGSQNCSSYTRGDAVNTPGNGSAYTKSLKSQQTKTTDACSVTTCNTADLSEDVRRRIQELRECRNAFQSHVDRFDDVAAQHPENSEILDSVKRRGKESSRGTGADWSENSAQDYSEPSPTLGGATGLTSGVPTATAMTSTGAGYTTRTQTQYTTPGGSEPDTTRTQTQTQYTATSPGLTASSPGFNSMRLRSEKSMGSRSRKSGRSKKSRSTTYRSSRRSRSARGQTSESPGNAPSPSTNAAYDDPCCPSTMNYTRSETRSNSTPIEGEETRPAKSRKSQRSIQPRRSVKTPGETNCGLCDDTDTASSCDPCKTESSACDPCKTPRPRDPCDPCDPCKAPPRDPCNPCDPCDPCKPKSRRGHKSRGSRKSGRNTSRPDKSSRRSTRSRKATSTVAARVGDPCGLCTTPDNGKKCRQKKALKKIFSRPKYKFDCPQQRRLMCKALKEMS